MLSQRCTLCVSYALAGLTHSIKDIYGILYARPIVHWNLTDADWFITEQYTLSLMYSCLRQTCSAELRWHSMFCLVQGACVLCQMEYYILLSAVEVFDFDLAA